VLRRVRGNRVGGDKQAETNLVWSRLRIVAMLGAYGVLPRCRVAWWVCESEGLGRRHSRRQATSQITNGAESGACCDSARHISNTAREALGGWKLERAGCRVGEVGEVNGEIEDIRG